MLASLSVAAQLTHDVIADSDSDLAERRLERVERHAGGERVRLLCARSDVIRNKGKQRIQRITEGTVTEPVGDRPQRRGL